MDAEMLRRVEGHIQSLFCGSVIGALGGTICSSNTVLGPVVGALGKPIGNSVIVGAAVVISLAGGFAGALAIERGQFKPLSAIGGMALSLAAIAFATSASGDSSPELPVRHHAAVQATTVVAEGKCKDVQTQFTGKDGQRVEFILPSGCALKP